MIRISAEHITPRLDYTCRELFGDRFRIIHTGEPQPEPPHLWYADSPGPSGTLHIVPSGLLSETGTSEPAPATGTFGGMPVLFPQETAVGFDIFSAVFYLLTRYEEYQAPSDAFDSMGRYRASASVLWKSGSLESPLVDRWRCALIKQLGMNDMFSHAFKVTSTIDVDSAFAYRHKGLYRTAGGIAKDLIRFAPGNLFRRIASLLRLSHDPYDTYAHIKEVNRRYGLPLQWFFLLADFGTYDKGLPHTSRKLRALIASLDGHDSVGIHPGVRSNEQKEVLGEEIQRMVGITRRPCVHARQHYLILSFPLTYQRLLRAGIRHDHSMGYAEHIGFRAGTSRPFRWYDLSSETLTDLTIHPFACMDTTLNKYMKLTPQEAIERVERLAGEARRYQGEFTTLWHNETLSETGIWKGWRKVYEEILSRLSQEGHNG